MFRINKFKINENNLHIIFDSKKDNDRIEISFRMRDNEQRWGLLERTHEYLVKPIKCLNGYEFNLNMTDLINKFQGFSGKRNVIDVHVKDAENYYKLTVTKEIVEYIKSKSQISLTPLLNLKYYVINNEAFAIQLLAKNIKSVLNSLKIEKEVLNFNITTSLNNVEPGLHETKLIVKQRSILNTPQTYCEWQSISADGRGSFFLKANVFNAFRLDEKEIFDLFVEYNDNNFTVQVPLHVGQVDMIIKKWCELDGVYSLDVVKGKTGNLSIRTIQRTVQVNISEIGFEQGYLTLKLKNDFEVMGEHLPKVQIRSYLDGMHNKDTTVFYEQEISVIPEEENALILLNLEDIFANLTSNYKRKFKIFIKVGSQLYKLSLLDTMNPSSSFNRENQVYKLKTTNCRNSFKLKKSVINCFVEDTLMLEASYLDLNPMPIAIMGSCFSRSAFNSADYFNPEYKKNFQVPYSYFWPSIIGLVSEPVPYDKEWFSDLSQGNISEIEWEFLKNWDQALKDSGSKYLLLDFFVDAMHGVVQLDSNQYICRNLYTRKAKYYQNTLLKTGKGMDCFHPDYFELWTSSFDKFVEKIKGIIPEENIILNLSLLTDRFYDLNGGITSFFDSKHITKARFMHVNNTWRKMNNYFISKLPNAKVIDMVSFQYIGQADAPADLVSLGPHHFESGYYKSLLNELCKAVGTGANNRNLVALK